MNGSRDLSLRWLLRLRWTAILAQAATVALCQFGLAIALPIGPLAVVLLVAAGSQLLLSQATQRPWPATAAVIGSALMLDTLLLTALLYLTGGPHNPFSAFFLIHIAMAASLLGVAWTWALLVEAVACFGCLFRWNQPLGIVLHSDPICGLRPVDLHLVGMFVALTLTGACLAWFVARINLQLREREAALHAAELRAEREARVAAIAALTAGVAHEISSPLGAIAVASRELEREAAAAPETLAEDARFICREVERCQRILGRLRASGEPGQADLPASLRAADVVASLCRNLRPGVVERLRLEVREPDAVCHAPEQALLQALGNLVSNALDASPAGTPVTLEVAAEGGAVSFTVVDQGAGLPPRVADRLGEPFVTTKAPGQGTGLGLFLVRRFAEMAGGGFRITSTPPAGTRARLEVPREACG